MGAHQDFVVQIVEQTDLREETVALSIPIESDNVSIRLAPSHRVISEIGAPTTTTGIPQAGVVPKRTQLRYASKSD